MAMRICLEQDYVLKTLAKSKKNDLAVVDIDNIDPKYVREAVGGRGVHVYAYLNACALEKERDYYESTLQLKSGRSTSLARQSDSKRPEQKVYILTIATFSTCASPDLEKRKQSLLNLLLERGQCMSLFSK